MWIALPQDIDRRDGLSCLFLAKEGLGLNSEGIEGELVVETIEIFYRCPRPYKVERLFALLVLKEVELSRLLDIFGEGRIPRRCLQGKQKGRDGEKREGEAGEQSPRKPFPRAQSHQEKSYGNREKAHYDADDFPEVSSIDNLDLA